MNEYIKISQLASLMGISTHQIRYFEEKGIFNPAFIEKNGYRMYGINEIYEMLHILFFRELDISVKDISILKKTDMKADYLSVLTEKKDDIETNINKLIGLKKSIEKTIQILDEVKENNENYKSVELDEIKLKVLKGYDHHHVLNAQDMLQISKENSHYNLLNTLQIYDESKYYVCVEDERNFEYSLSQGTYIYKIENVDSYQKAEMKVTQFFKQLKKKSIQTEGPLLIQDLHQASITSGHSISIKIMMKVKNEKS
jgi:DNA-binding transcriptional MerR regulator